MIQKFDFKFLEDAKQFLFLLDGKAIKKLLSNIEKAKILNDSSLFKKLHGEIWEMRVQFRGNQYRFLCFWDKRDKANTLVVATHGFVKKRSTIPIKEIEKAEAIRIRYFD